MNHTPHRAFVRARRFVIFSTVFFLLLSAIFVWRDAAASGQPLRQYAATRATQLLARTTPGRAMLASFFAMQAVTSSGDSGAGTLRDTIAAAAAGDTIVFSGVATVPLTSGELAISENLTIAGDSGVMASAMGAASSALFSLTYTTPFLPVLGTYGASSVGLSGQTTVTPSAAPINSTSLVATASSGFNGTLRVNPATGEVSVVNAYPAGTHTITVYAFGPSGMTSASFALTVQTGTACGTVPLFTSAADVTNVSSPLGTAVGDFNNDGKQDLVTTNGSNATASIRLGDGAGGFTGTTTVSTPSNPNAVAVGDFNGDGNQDIAVSSSNNAVAIRLGDGAGGFTGTTNITTGQTTKSIAVGDFNNDGKLDFVTADIGGDTATVALGNGAGGFPTVSSVSVGDGPGQVVVADFNNDGNLDFATSNQIYNAPNFGSPGTVTVRLGNGDGTFTNGPSYNVGDNPEYLAVGDFNEDGKPDLITSNQNSASLSLILGDVSNTATPPTTISVSSGPGEIRVADINNDGHQDVVFKRSGLENFAYLLGTGTGSFGTAVIVPVTGAAGTKLAVGDFNADGFQDFVTANFGTNTLFVRLGGCNVAPTITAVTPGVTISRQQGSAGTSDTIATVNDTETLKQNLTVAVMGTPPTGISVTSISAPDATTGAVTATIRAGCNAATGNNTVVLKVTDGNGATATANLTVTVSAATPPTPASAGSDQTFCNITTATLAANTPSVGTGAWSVVSGPSTSTAQFNSLTNPAANFTPAGGTGIYTLRWTITGACATSTDDVALTFTANPTTANAGPDQTLCTTSATLAANNPTVGTGVWSIISGVGGSVATPSSPTSTFSGVAGTTYTLRWTISNSPCTASTDDVVITLSANPTTANAGPDQNVCATSATLAANTPTSGTGAWSIVSGTGGSFVNAASPTSTFNGTAGTTYTLRWTISNSPCTASADDVVITLTSNPTTANAGVDQTLCNVTSVTMAGNAVNTGTGTWTQVNGPNTATITSPNLPTTTMTGLVAGVYTFQWTIANAPCTASSDQVTITINAAPVMTTQPTNQSVALNGTATFTAAASGTPAPTVKWQVSTDGGANYTDLSGQTSTTLTLSNVTAGMNGNRYRAVFANSCITINSNAATLIIGCVSSLTVNNTSDGTDATPGNGVCETATGNGICTLRAALQEANALTTCTPFTINFSVTGTILLSSNLPVIAHPNLTITGPGANQLTVDGASSYQPFIIGGGNYAVTLSGLKVANGRANGGAGLLNLSTGTVNVNNLSFEGNQVTNSTGGGGIRHDSSSGTLNVTGSTFRNNSAIPTGGGGTAGGGISNASTGTVNVTNCTFNGNRGTLGGGIHNQVGGTINVTNCTLVGNSAEGVNSGGGGINNNSGTATVTNTIAVGNTASSNPDLRGTFTTSNNLTGSQTTALLGTLGNYGGTTDTYPLLPGSPAINAGTSSGAPATDQRGVARPQQTGVDIGAFESRGFTLAVNSGNNQSTVAGSNFTNSLQVTVTSSNSEPVDGGQVTFIPPGSGATASVAGSPATISSGVASSGTVTANLIIGGPYNVTATANGNSPTSFSLTNTNSPPSFTPASTITRQQGSPAGAAIMIGTVSDAQTAVGSLVVTQISGGTATGITATNITNTTGTITAQISASCMATAGTVRFQVSDGSATGTGDFQVNITANTMPTLMYGNITATAGGATSNSPTTATDNGSIDSYSVFGQGTYTGNISVNSSGVVLFSNAAPTGTHTITIRATDNCGASKDAMFTVTVNCQNITVTPPTEHYASLNVPFSQNFTQSGAVGTATFTLQSGTLPLGIQLQPNGTLSGTTNQSGDFPITVKVTDSNGCTGVSATYTIETGVQIPFSAKISDPLACTGENNILSVHAEVVNPNNVAANLNFNASLPATLTGVGASCQSSYGTCTVNAGSVTVTGSLPANQTVTIDYKVRVANGTPQGTQLCVTSTASLNNAAPAMVQACTILNCPTGAPANVLAGGQKAGSLLVFPYYTSKTAPRRDTRLTISNTGTQTTYAHIFFIDGTSCDAADQFVCLSPNASASFKASEYDPDATGWLLAVAVNNEGVPVQSNSLIGNAFVEDGDYVDNYAAEAFRAFSPWLAAIQNATATLFLDGASYDAAPSQFAIEVQSPLDAPSQRVVIAALQGDLTTGQMSGASQVGSGLIFNGNEKPFGSFSSFVIGKCQAFGTITTTTPRVPNGMSVMIPRGQVGTLKFNVGAGVGLLMTPRTAPWRGIRTLHKTALTTATLTIPIIRPVC